jgi:hypothetical protein
MDLNMASRKFAGAGALLAKKIKLHIFLQNQENSRMSGR